MRIGHLDLTRYGHFTDTPLAFPGAECDLYIVFGHNEAGKSTALSALGDLLFGVPKNSPYGFLHAYPDMRIGGLLEHAGSALAFQRRKGSVNTVLSPDGTPLPQGDAALAPFLGGGDRTFFERMFSLDHTRLDLGGREMLEAKDEAGQTLFAAGAGLSGLRALCGQLDSEAAELWTGRRAGHRKYYVATDAWLAADQTLRAHLVTAAKWTELADARNAADTKYQAIVDEISHKNTELRRVSRIRRVFPLLGKLGAVNGELALLGKVAPLPPDADSRLAAAVMAHAVAAGSLDTSTAQLQSARAERTQLHCDDSLLSRGQDVVQLREQLGQIQGEEADLPKRRGELVTLTDQLLGHAHALEWVVVDGLAVLGKIPAPAITATMRELQAQQGALLLESKHTSTAVGKTETRIKQLQNQRAALETALEVAALGAMIDATPNLAEVAARIQTAQQAINVAQLGIGRRLQRLRPALTEEATWVALPVPARSAVQAHRDELHKLEERANTIADTIAAAERELGRHQREALRIVHDQAVVAVSDLDDARAVRDECWSVIRRYFIEHKDVPSEAFTRAQGESPNLAAAYEERVETADALADRRFDKAQAAGQLAAVNERIAALQFSLEELYPQEVALKQKQRDLEAKWNALWAESRFDPLGPDQMLEWLARRDELLQLVEDRDKATEQLGTLKSTEEGAHSALVVQLGLLGEDTSTFNQQRARVVLELARGIQRRHLLLAEGERTADTEIQRLEDDAAAQRIQLGQAQQDWQAWVEKWEAALAALGFPPGTTSEALGVHLDAIEVMRQLGEQIKSLQERIDNIIRDITAFKDATTALAAAVAPKLALHDAKETVRELERQLEEAKQARWLQEAKDKSIVELGNKHAADVEAVAEAGKAIAGLHALADTTNLDDLRGAIVRAERQRDLLTESADAERALMEAADDHSVVVLRKECAGADPDQLATQEDTLHVELQGAQEQLTPATEIRALARAGFDAVGGDDVAAQAAAAKQEAVVAMREAAEEYVQVRTASTVLQWAIERYRREQQGPLLQRAGGMFETLTRRSFTGLQLAFDAADHAYLVGVRPDQQTVPVDGMSAGTRDQLYLALRLSSVEDHVSHAHALPFLADDLLINFDDERAVAALKVLGVIARRSTQVLLFTHHQRLVDLARSALGADAHIIELAST